MMNRSPRRPGKDEYAPFYETYVSKVGEGDIVDALLADRDEMRRFLSSIPAHRHDVRYAPGKWTTKEVVGHVLDAETVFAYRALCFARADPAPLPGMDQNVFMAGADFGVRSMTSLIDQFGHQRAANAAMFEQADDEVLGREGVASDCRFTVRALLFIMAGHARHHMGVLRERYL